MPLRISDLIGAMQRDEARFFETLPQIEGFAGELDLPTPLVVDALRDYAQSHPVTYFEVVSWLMDGLSRTELAAWVREYSAGKAKKQPESA